MAYTTDQLAAVRQAIIDLSTGQRVVSITHNGRTVQYAQTDINKLRELERTIAGSLKTGRRSRTRFAVTSKGL